MTEGKSFSTRPERGIIGEVSGNNPGSLLHERPHLHQQRTEMPAHGKRPRLARRRNERRGKMIVGFEP
jgi:hypothetical protein